MKLRVPCAECGNDLPILDWDIRKTDPEHATMTLKVGICVSCPIPITVTAPKPTPTEEEIDNMAAHLHALECFAGCPHPINELWRDYARRKLLEGVRA